MSWDQIWTVLNSPIASATAAVFVAYAFGYYRGCWREARFWTACPDSVSQATVDAMDNEICWLRGQLVRYMPESKQD